MKELRLNAALTDANSRISNLAHTMDTMLEKLSMAYMIESEPKHVVGYLMDALAPPDFMATVLEEMGYFDNKTLRSDVSGFIASSTVAAMSPSLLLSSAGVFPFPAELPGVPLDADFASPSDGADLTDDVTSLPSLSLVSAPFAVDSLLAARVAEAEAYGLAGPDLERLRALILRYSDVFRLSIGGDPL
ncbi:hypothetical protein H310_12675 [Aphanomyces invadans]|uniref:Uncharacterized protein n=1 Tax=Aphanomyces invadans TaxID=157072 RepID=A0A024TI11_9STRA|nr:hypothetical protein H310_12675 [Aphanomyces invadans]ETV93231.1 hypothetical protein H310_12675 [Aphanomyces invadans]|eukprot:XP_008878066.1 hypothetical protein H310_12675 [Aphanomyces invadans]